MIFKFCYNVICSTVENRGSNPVRWTQSPALYNVAIKAGLCLKAVHVCYIPIPGDIVSTNPAPSKLKFVPEFLGAQERYLRSCRHTRGLFTVGAKFNRWTILMLQLGLNLVRWTQSLSRRYKNRLVPQGIKCVFYTYIWRLIKTQFPIGTCNRAWLIVVTGDVQTTYILKSQVICTKIN